MPVYTSHNKLSTKRPKDELKNVTKYFIPFGLMVTPNHIDKYDHPTRELIPAAAILTGKQIKKIIYDYANEVGLSNLHLRLKDCINLTSWQSVHLELTRVFSSENISILQYVYMSASSNHTSVFVSNIYWLLAKHVDQSHLVLILNEYAKDSAQHIIIKARLAGLSF
jgi:hypothetical protein